MTTGEAWLYDEHPALFRSHPFLFGLLAITVVGWLVIGVWAIVNRRERLAIGRGDILYERGLIAKERIQLNRESVRSVRVQQGMFQRMFDVGDVALYTAGDEAEIAIRGVPRPNAVRMLVAGDGAGAQAGS
jgi:uncharacterized membrane protein YdbT with pleckstrin-like domain